MRMATAAYKWGYPAWAGIDPMMNLKILKAFRLPRVGGDRPPLVG